MPTVDTPTARRETADFGDVSRYDQTHTYSRESGLIAVPVAGRTPAVRIIRLHGGYGFRRIDWVADKNGNPPVIPCDQNTLGDVLLSSSVAPKMPVLNAEKGGYSFSVAGSYLYVQMNPRVVGVNPLPTGDCPFELAPVSITASIYGAGGDMSGFGNQGSPGAPNPYDVWIQSLPDKIPVSSDGNAIWPFTGIPTIYSSNDLFGG